MSKILKEKPDEQKLAQLGIKNWGTWECEPSRFPWEYDDKETCYVLEGRVTVETLDGETVEIEPGDLVAFPKGLQCTWDSAREDQEGVPIRVSEGARTS